MKKTEKEEKKIIMELEIDTNEEKENEPEFGFLGLLAMMSYRSLPEDYWEKEGIGWK